MRRSLYKLADEAKVLTDLKIEKAVVEAKLLRLACRRSSSAGRSLEIGDVLKVMAPN
jgi:hypothetical protein